jgi:predicted transglutaminase-like cysteine proteinase
MLGVALAFATLSTYANSALFSSAKSLNVSPLDGVEMNFPIFGPSAGSFYCIEHLTACQRGIEPIEDNRRELNDLEAKPLQSRQILPEQQLQNQIQLKRVALFGLPKQLKSQLDHVPQDRPALAPMAHTMFCLKYPRDCEAQKVLFRKARLDLTTERLAELTAINSRINGAIRPAPNMQGLAGEKWLISPALGDCNDYAVTKRHELLDRGWPSRSLLLAEVVTPSGEHHLVVVVRTKQGDYVLDNLSPAIRLWAKVPYRWVRMQSVANPKFWSSIKAIGRSV